MEWNQLLDRISPFNMEVNQNGKLLVSPASRLTTELRIAIRTHREALIGLCKKSPSPRSDPRELSIDDLLWRGQKLKSPIAIDCETEWLTDRIDIPHLALASVSDGHQHFILEASSVVEFLKSHADAEYVAHNAAFDYWVLWQHIGPDRSLWENVADERRLHCTMLMEQLIWLAKEDDLRESKLRLDVLAKQYETGIAIDKDDPYRVRYTEIIGKDLLDVERGFIDYAILDPIATHKIWQRQSAIAKQIADRHAIPDETRHRWGPLSLGIQVQGAIAIADMERRGLGVDQDYANSVRDMLKEEVTRAIATIQKIPDSAELFQTTKDGEIAFTDNGEPQIKKKDVLLPLLENIAKASCLDISRTEKNDEISTKVENWKLHRDCHPFLDAWIALKEKGKRLQFFRHFDQPRVHPRYKVLVRTGRTSTSTPNCQNIPKDKTRGMIVPSPGHWLMATDYSALELRTLAFVCEYKFGFSKLGDVIRQGVDPHCYTAAMILGITLDEFLSWKESKPDEFTKFRQRAKIFNFGIGGGLSAPSLKEYALKQYSVEMSLDEATEFRRKLIEDIYPELKLYLDADDVGLVAANLKTSAQAVQTVFDEGYKIGMARKVVQGKPIDKKGKEYAQRTIDNIWNQLKILNNNPLQNQILCDHEAGPELYKRLFGFDAVVPTGRLRGGVGYTQAVNCPFQGLGCDIGKLAMYRLVREGFRLCGFVHDEFLIEIPQSHDYSAKAKLVEEICREAMAEILGDMRPEVESTIGPRWSKDASSRWEDGTLTIWEEQSTSKPTATTIDNLDIILGNKYGAIYVDPPWKYGNQCTRNATDRHYSTMTLEELAELPVANLAAPNCHLHLWATEHFRDDAIQLMKGWGFTFKSTQIWNKKKMGMGNRYRLQHEYLLLGERGKPKFNDKSCRSVVCIPRTNRHSEKPDYFREQIEKVSNGPYLELFGRKAVAGWTVFGNQIDAI